MELNGMYITPMDQTESYAVGYLSGQRTLRTNAYLTSSALKNVAVFRYAEMSSTSQINLRDFVRGVQAGYRDERAGLAHPLPANDVGYHHNDINHC